VLEHFPISLNRDYVMAALVAAIHALRRDEKDVDARDKPAHDGVNVIGKCSNCAFRVGHSSRAISAFDQERTFWRRRDFFISDPVRNPLPRRGNPASDREHSGSQRSLQHAHIPRWRQLLIDGSCSGEAALIT